MRLYTLPVDRDDVEADAEQYGRLEDVAEAARCGEPWPPWSLSTIEQNPPTTTAEDPHP